MNRRAQPKPKCAHGFTAGLCLVCITERRERRHQELLAALELTDAQRCQTCDLYARYPHNHDIHDCRAHVDAQQDGVASYHAQREAHQQDRDTWRQTDRTGYYRY